MDDNWFDDESGSETENIDNETTEDEEESDPDGNYMQRCSYSSTSDMVWSSTPSHSSATKHHDNVNLTSGHLLD